MKMLKTIALLLLVLALLLASCGGNNDDEDQFLPTATNTPSEPEPTFTVGMEATAAPTPTSAGAGVPQTDATVEGTVEPGDEIPETGSEAAIPPEVAQFAGEWPMANKDYANTRAALDASISAENIDQLRSAWAFRIPGVGSYGGAATTPLIMNGRVYFQDLASNIIALDLESGEVIWEHQISQNVIGPNGVAIGYDKIFGHGGENQMHALDLESGELIWTAVLEGPTGAQQPYVFDGRVYTAAVAGAVAMDQPGNVESRRGYAPGHSGIIYAFDQESGEMVWRFQVIEEDFWGHPEINGGGGVWYPPGIDTKTGLTFWGTGNPAPFPGIVGYPNAASRPGPNLYTNALVALDGATGEMVWYNQVKPRDLFDLDFQISPILTEAQIDGQEREIVIGSGKLGRVFAFDRESGEILWETLVGIHQNDELQEVPAGEEILVLPGVWGGVETPMAMAEGVLFAVVLNLGTPYTADGFGATDGIQAVAAATGRTQLNTATSELIAIDINNGEILWTVEYDSASFGAATVVNDLVFTSTFDGVIRAHARADGREVWTFQAPGGINGWPAVHDDTIVFPVGVGDVPVMMAFRLGAEGADIPLPRPTMPPSP
jgi:glucose dehydrogenase